MAYINSLLMSFLCRIRLF